MKNNIKFLIKISVVFILAMCILLVASSVYKNGLTYQGSYSGIEKFESVPDGIEFANFGPSYGMSCFNYEDIESMGKTCFNFSLTMQDIYHDYAIYKKYEEKFSDGAVVAIPLSYFSFCSDTKEPSGNRYYKIIDREYIKDYTPENEVSTKIIPVYGKGSSLVRDLLNDTLDSIMKKSVNKDKDEDIEVNNEEESDVVKLHDDSKTRVLTIENGNLKAYADHISVNEEILVNWIEEMKEKGLKPVLLLTPYWYEYAYGFDEELLKKSYNDPVSRVIKKTGVDYINFCGEEYDEYIHTPENFNNCDHVSKEGSKEFMKLYLNYLVENELIKN